jgi:hypothetical protein
MWMRLLTVAVVAPYLYKVSSKETGYFGVGLKLVAGGLIVSQIPALLKDYETVAAQAKKIAANLVKAQETLDKQNAARVVVSAEAEEAEFTESA